MPEVTIVRRNCILAPSTYLRSSLSLSLFYLPFSLYSLFLNQHAMLTLMGCWMRGMGLLHPRTAWHSLKTPCPRHHHFSNSDQSRFCLLICCMYIHCMYLHTHTSIFISVVIVINFFPLMLKAKGN